MDVLVTGSTGFIGSALVTALEQRGDRVVRLRRGATGTGAAGGAPIWDIDAEYLSPGALDGIDAVVHLAGEGIGEKKWTPEQKRRIRESRSNGTGLIAGAIARQATKPAVLVSGSAVGCYGDRGDELLDETSALGTDFLADVCREWEGATQPAADAGVRVVTIRTGIVLAPGGGVLKRLLLPFKLGLGGRVGSGRQWMSWITLGDEVGAILRALDDVSLRGPVDLTAPNPVTNADFGAALGRVLHRPTVLPTPLLPLKVRYGGELVAALLLASQRVVPRKLEAAGYVFAHTDLDAALRAIL